MGLDIRLPIGSFFVIVGVLLTAYGVFGSSEIYARSLGININLIWGITLVVFGSLMWFFGRRADSHKERK